VPAGETKETSVARQFPSIVNLGSAFRFALEAEQAGADFAAAAGVVAPDEAWQAKLEELLCAHDDRAAKLGDLGRQVNEMTLEPLHSLDGSSYAAVLGGEPAATWPAAAEQMAVVEDTIAAYHETLVAHAGDVLAAQARALTKSAKQARDAAAQIRAMLD
jgi:hypothetical protein